jgi:sugar O-acyltransferase (sialic acid O-acetyltransferase NeuD family)
MSIHWVKADRDSPSDEMLIVEKLMVDDGADVKRGDVIIEVEGSKSLFEITAPESGSVFFYVQEGESMPVGRVIACITVTGEVKPPIPASHTPEAPTTQQTNSHDRFSIAALELLFNYGIDPDTFKPDLDFVTEADVRAAITHTSCGTSPKHSTQYRRVTILGGGHMATLAYEIAAGDPSLRVIGVFDDHQNSLSGLGVPLLGGLGDFPSLFQADEFDEAVIGIQSNRKVRKKLIEDCASHGIPLCTLIHQQSFVSRSATVGLGCIIMDSARVGPFATLGANVFVSGLVNIDHHCHIGSNTTFGPGVFLSGNVNVGEDCDFGTSVGVEPGVNIGDRCSVSSGSIIHSDIPSDHVAKIAKHTIIRPRRA